MSFDWIIKHMVEWQKSCVLGWPLTILGICGDGGGR